VWENVITLLAGGRIDLDPVLNRVAPLEEWHDVFGEMHSGKIVKGVLKTVILLP
jgi:Zn-dependent alcohol dehydrogenase